MKVTRKGVFETNSSSVHSLAITNNYYPQYPESEYVVIPNDYQWGYDTCDSVEEKLSYLVTLAACYSDTRDEFIENPDVVKIVNTVKNHNGANVIFKFPYGFGSIDHQSINSVEGFLCGTELEDFIFNSKYKVIIDNDNH